MVDYNPTLVRLVPDPSGPTGSYGLSGSSGLVLKYENKIQDDILKNFPDSPLGDPRQHSQQLLPEWQVKRAQCSGEVRDLDQVSKCTV